MHTRLTHRFAPIVFAIFCTSLFLLIGIGWLNPVALWSPDEGAKLLYLRSLRWENNQLLYDVLYPERILDPTLTYAILGGSSELFNHTEDLLQFRRLPIFQAVTYPFYQGLGMAGLLILPAIGGGLIIFNTLSLLPAEKRRWEIAIAVALGSPILIYATLFWEHTLASGLVLTAVTLTLNLSQRENHTWWAWGALGVLFAIGTYLRLETSLLVAAFLFASWLFTPTKRRHLLLLGFIFACVMVFYGPAHSWLFDQTAPQNATYLFYPFTYLKTAGWYALPDLLMGPTAAGSLPYGQLGILWSVLAVVAIGLSWWRTHLTHQLMWLIWGVTAVIAFIFLLHPTFYRSVHGLLFSTPWILIGLCRLPNIWAEANRTTKILMVTLVVGLANYIISILVFRAAPPHGELEWGARFALTFYPLFALFAFWPVSKQNTTTHIMPRIVLPLILLSLGIGFQARGLWVIQHDKQNNAQLNEVITTSPTEHVLTDIAWLRYNAAPVLLEDKYLYIANDPLQMGQWVETAVSQQVTTFTFITTEDNTLQQIPHPLRPLSQQQFGIFYIYHVQVIL